MKPKFKYLQLYERHQEYGGPEEGGWYYNWYTPIGLPVRVKTKGWEPIKRYQKIYLDMFNKQVEYGKYHHMGGIELIVDEYPYESQTKHAHHYE